MSWSGQDRPQHALAGLRSGRWPEAPGPHPARIDFVDLSEPSPFAPRPPAAPGLRDADALADALARLSTRAGAPPPGAGRDPLAATLADLDRRLRETEFRAGETAQRGRTLAPPRLDPARDDWSRRSARPVAAEPPRAAPRRAPEPAPAAERPRPAPARPEAPPRPAAMDGRVTEHFRALATQIDTLRITQDQAFVSLQEEMAALRALLDARSGADAATLASHLAEVERRLARLAADVPARGEFSALGGSVTDLHSTVTGLYEAVAELRDAVSRAGDAGIATGDALVDLSRGQARLATRLEEVARTFAESSPARALAEIARRLDALDASKVDPALLSALGERLERLAANGLDAPVAAALTRKVGELASALEQTARKADVERIERGTQRLGALLEKVSLRLDAESGPDQEQQAALAALSEQTEAIRTRLEDFHPDRLAEAVASGLGALDRLAEDVRASLREAREGAARDLSDLARRLDGFEARLGKLGPDARTGASLERLEGAVAGISRELTELAERTRPAEGAVTAETLAERLTALDARLEQAEERTAHDIRHKVDEQLQALAADLKAGQAAHRAATEAPAGAPAAAAPADAGATAVPPLAATSPRTGTGPALPFAMTADDAEDRTGGPVTLKLRAELRRLKEAAAQAGNRAPDTAPASGDDDETPAATAPAAAVADVAGAGDLIAAARRAARPLQRSPGEEVTAPSPPRAPASVAADAPTPTPTPVRPVPADARPAPPRATAASPDPAAGPAVYPARPVNGGADVRAEPKPASASDRPAARGPAAPRASATGRKPVTETLPPLVEAVRAATDAPPPPRGGWRLPGHRALMGATAAAAVVSGAAYLAVSRPGTVTVTPETLLADRGQLAADIARLADRQRQQAEDPETTGSIGSAADAPSASTAAPLTAPTLTAPELTAPASESAADGFRARTAGPARHVTPATGPAAPAGGAPGQPETAKPPASSPGSKVAAVPAATGELPEHLPAAPGLKPRPVLPRSIGPLSLRAAAENGDPLAAHEIGLRYLDGRGVAADPALALAWFHKAAESGSVAGVFRVASMYEKGIGVPANLKTAADWYGVAAEAGNVKAMHNLAVLLSEGATGERDFAGAARWFEAAARHGLADSQFNIGVLYAQGIGVGYDLPTAWRWFALAAAQGDPEAAEQRDAAGERLDGAELANARAAVKAWRPDPVNAAVNSVPPVNPGWMESGPAT